MTARVRLVTIFFVLPAFLFMSSGCGDGSGHNPNCLLLVRKLEGCGTPSAWWGYFNLDVTSPDRLCESAGTSYLDCVQPCVSSSSCDELELALFQDVGPVAECEMACSEVH